MKSNLVNLYNAIKNDYSIQRYTMQASDVLTSIEHRFKYKPIECVDIEFSDRLLIKAIETTTHKGLKNLLISFSKELSINIETLNTKYYETYKR